MQINTSTVLNLLGANVDPNIKQKVKAASVDGKSDLSVLIKDKSIQTLLSDTFNSLIQNTKSKTETFQFLQNSKNLFDIKSFSNDIKSISNLLQNTDNQKLKNHSAILKEFFVNIKNLNENILKNNISNSGIHYESKLKDITALLKEPLLAGKIEVHKVLELLGKDIQNIQKKGLDLHLVQNIKNNILNLQTSIEKSDLTLQIKTAVSNILNQIAKLPLDKNSATLDQKALKDISQNIKNLETAILKDISKNINQNNYNTLQKNISSFIENINSILNKGIDEPKLQNLQNLVSNISSSLKNADIEVEVKTAINNLLNQTTQVLKNPNGPSSSSILNTLLSTLSNNANTINNSLLNSLSTKVALNTQIQNPLPTITQDIKGVLLQVMQELEKLDPNISVSKELKPLLDKSMAQIEYFQALSFTTSSSHTFLPFSWENIEDGDINFSNDSQENFSCQINLNLKEKGEIKILLEMDKQKYLNVNMGIEKQKFKAQIQEKLQILRHSFSKIGLNLQSLNVFDISKNSVKNNPYQNTDGFDFGLDIKA